MSEKSMTALVSAFARAYHVQENEEKVFDDSIAGQLLTQEEYNGIAKSMADGIGFFCPGFGGTPAQALRWVVEHQLAPSPLGRAVFAERALETAVRVGARQYLILGAGYDTFAYRQPDWAERLRIFEVDQPATAQDKRMRLQAAGIALPGNVFTIEVDFNVQGWQTALVRHPVFDRSAISFCSLLGVTYYLRKQAFASLLATLGTMMPQGSAVAFDYPGNSSGANCQAMLAKAANEEMLADYTEAEMEQMLAAHGFLLYEHLTPAEITEQYFRNYNCAYPDHPMAALDAVYYGLAVRQNRQDLYSG